ncbi:MAG: tRNA adenosine deaminase-associated protein [Geodermatophilaceae bacterium]|jgi:putative tRNA adenosine deaminase-associated protein|nr:tRNA adenosine deaminase-associated protein [Geodermatophilaceae bacterium]MDQ3464765.1 tRNA adenosine deaminase-associated protein [Actinomycetota bacterium]
MAAEGSAVAVCREEGRWHCDLLPPAVLDDLEHCIAALRQQPSEGGPIALLNVEDEFFVALRIRPDASVGLLLSDVTAAADWELARQVAEYLDEDIPDDAPDDEEEVWPVGDIDLFADLGLPAEEMRMIVDNIELYADEMLAQLAGRLGFRAEFEAVVEALPSR